MSETSRKHKKEAPRILSIAILTVSTSKYHNSRNNIDIHDLSGDLIESLLIDSGHTIIKRGLVPDDRITIQRQVKQILDNREVDALIVTGGTGISQFDVTIEAVEDIFEKQLPGFGEFFRWISYQEIGSSAIITRATAGTVRGKVVFLLPGSPNAVEIAVKKLILPEIAHIIKHARE